MAILPIERPVTPLRQYMLDDMAMRSLRARTQHDYIRHVRAFAAFLSRSPDTVTAENVRRFKVHQREHGAGGAVTGGAVSALRFLFRVMLDRPDQSRKLVLAPRPRKLPAMLSVEEVKRLLEAAPSIKYRGGLGVAYGADLRVSEVAHLAASSDQWHHVCLSRTLRAHPHDNQTPSATALAVIDGDCSGRHAAASSVPLCASMATRNTAGSEQPAFRETT